MSTTKLERATAIHLAFAVVAGIAAFAVAAIGGQPALGLAFLGMMLAYGAVATMFARRTETGAAMFGRRDERASRIDVRATALAGTAIGAAAIIGRSPTSPVEVMVSRSHGWRPSSASRT
jgi:hypothetical protein